ncbi:replication protein A 70 kDa DNA-binding subunit B [Trifolium repens]|nr:replication protein A 70 kDa DNA-binding subunit B [Trifolium repens]
MPKGYDNIKDITDKKEIWKLAVKVDDIWTVVKSNQELAEMIICDVKGDTIHVTIGPDEFKKRKDEVAQLMKMQTHLIKNFRVLKNEEKYKFSEHPFKLIFISGTSVNPLDIPDMPVSGYKFKKFEEVKAFAFREDLLYDLIGAVHEIGSAQTTASAGKLNISFTVKDLAGNILDCILWESTASKFIEHCKNRTEQGPLIIIFRHARLILPTDRYPLQISNAWTGTKLIINEDVPEINDFKNSLPLDNTYATQNQLMSSSSQRFSAQSSAAGSQLSPADQFIQGHRILKLSDIIKLNQDEIVVTVVTTDLVKPSDRGWYFLGCSSCIKQTYGNSPPYECKPLRHQTQIPDNTCIELLGVTAGELQKNMLKDGIDDPLDYPDDLNEMMGRTFAFRVNWKKEWRQGSVLEIKDSKDLVKKIKQEMNHGIATATNDESPSTIAIECSQSKALAVPDTLEEDDIIIELSATSEHDPDQSTKITPSKRPSAKANDDDKLPGQLSSNKPNKMILLNSVTCSTLCHKTILFCVVCVTYNMGLSNHVFVLYGL